MVAAERTRLNEERERSREKEQWNFVVFAKGQR